MQPFLFILLSVGFLWLRSSFGKITGGKFVGSLAQTLEKFASNNPNSWYKNLLQTVAIPSANVLGNVIMWSEFLSAILITLSAIYLLLRPEANKAIEIAMAIGLFVGMILNFNFYFASGWMSVSAESLNLLMFFVQLIGFIYTLKLILK